jgi:hypothetical protein
MTAGGCAEWGVRQFDYSAACRAAFQRDVAGRCFITTTPLQLHGEGMRWELYPISKLGPETCSHAAICPAGTKLVVDRFEYHEGSSPATGGSLMTIYVRLDLPEYRGVDIEVNTPFGCLICGLGSLMDINNEATGYYSMFLANSDYLTPCE